MSDKIRPRPSALTPTVFHEPWWLEAATAGAYQCVECSEGGNAVGRMPYLIRKKYGLPCGVMPDLTHFLGPAIDEGEGKEQSRFSRRTAITKELIAQLPKTSLFEIKCHRGMTDAIAFQEMNFRCTVQFTHEILPQTEDDVWKGLYDRRRGAIRRGLKMHDLVLMDDPEEFARFYESNLDERDLTNNMERAALRRVLSAALERGRGTMRGARDGSGALVAAIFCPRDFAATYFLLTSRKKESENGAICALIWEEIRAAMARGHSFDFDGILHAGMAQFFAGFSGHVTPRFVVRRMSLPARIAWEAHHFLNHKSMFF
jgi:hypothetical protein